MSRFWRNEECQQQAHMPIIVGSPRSGTTLLRLMLDAHPHLAIPPETGFLSISHKLSGSGNKLRERFFRSIVNYGKPANTWADFEIPQELFWTALTEIEPFSISDGYRSFYRLYASRHRKSYWGDKTPLYCRYLQPIRDVLPEARFIHIVRDGRDAALSLRRMWFSPGWEIETQASYWRDSVLAARRAGVGRDDYLEVRYEELILNTRETLQRVCAHVGLSFDERMLRYYEHAHDRLREHKGSILPNGNFLTQEKRLQQQIRTTQPPDPTCVFSWKRLMDPNEQTRFARVAGDLLEELGYEV